MASWGQAGRHRPHRVHAASTMRTCGPSTATASAGHTRTHARQATHLSGSILKSTDSTAGALRRGHRRGDRKSTRLNSSHPSISYAVFCLKKKKNQYYTDQHTANNTTQHAI